MSSDLSFLPGPMLLAPALALAIAVLWRRDRLFRQPWTGMLHDLTVPVLIGLVGFVYYQSFLLSTKWGWSACRLAPTIGLVHGYPLYSPNSGGVINGWLYGPIAPLIWLPAGWADSPLPALAIASLIDLVFLLAPLVIIARGHSDAHGGIRVSAFIYAAAGLVLVYPTWYMASALCSDTIAVSLGVLSCLALTWNGPPKARNLLLGAALGVCAALTKQTEATLVLAQVGWVSWVHGRKTAAKLIGSYSACAAVAASIVFTAMTPRDVILNMWTIPGSQKLVGAWHGAALELRDFLQYSLLFSVPCLFLWALANRRENVGARPSRNDRGALLFLLVTLVQLPLGIAATIKIGGDRNSMHSVYYLACAFLCFSGTRIRLGPAFGTFVRSISLCAAAVATVLAARQVAAYPSMKMLPQRCLSQEAWLVAKQRPFQTYFPMDPLATLMAEGKMYHFEYGVFDRKLAGIVADDAQIVGGIPAHLDTIFYPRAEGAHLMVDRYLTDYRFVAATPDWLIYKRR